MARLALCVVCAVCVAPATLSAQTVTYHLHKEKGQLYYPLLPAPPDSAPFAIQTADLKGTTNTSPQIAAFQSDVASINNGTIPAGAMFTVSAWLKKSSTASVVYPNIVVTAQQGLGQIMCSSTGTTPLTTTLSQYTLSCASAAPLVLIQPMRFVVGINASFSTLPGNHSLVLELDVEGTLNGNYDSQFIVPQPVQAATLTALDRTGGIPGDSVMISGAGFGATQGSSGVTFNGAPAPISILGRFGDHGERA